MRYKNLYIAIPLQNESDYIEKTLNCIFGQSFNDYKIFICINQPDEWWKNGDKIAVCIDNKSAYGKIAGLKDKRISIIDRFTPGNGWKGKIKGVGWARKTVMDKINETAGDNDLIVSLDADTLINKKYFESIINIFNEYPDAVGLSAPYYHNLTGTEELDRAMLKYEIYLRYYALNMLRIRSPYCFTALGSAMAFPARAYRAVRGITPFQSGEDFYFLQKLVKFGRLLHWSEEKVYPANRISERVNFGTGRAMKNDIDGKVTSYPIYHFSLFDEIKETYDKFEQLYERAAETPMDSFICKIFGENDIWQPLRNNYKDINNFKRACAAKIDGLRIFQYLKFRHKTSGGSNENNFMEFLKRFYNEIFIDNFRHCDINFSFQNSEINFLDKIRNILEQEELSLRASSIINIPE